MDRDNIGTPAAAGGIVQVIGNATSTNVLVPLVGGLGPAIDYSFDIQWEPASASVTAAINHGSFPAIEMYARQPGGEWTAVIERLPRSTPWSLGDDPLFGITTHREVQKVTIPGMAGNWEPAGPEQRFSLYVTTTSVKWSERNAGGQVFTREVPLSEISGGSFRIERPNDAATLAFLGFQPAITAEILARGPLPSFMTLTWTGQTLRGEWNGLLITKHPNGRLNEIIQPGTRPAKTFTFARRNP